MFEKYNIRTDPMPAEMGELLAIYPRDTWQAHPGFREKTRHWLGAHQMFRGLAAQVRKDAEGFLDNAVDSGEYAERLSSLGGALVANLHGHHRWEDASYFPELSAADPRFERGLEVLEKDHADLDQVLDDFVGAANRAIKLIDLDVIQARDEVGAFHGCAECIETFLKRHLADEEELAVPIILHHRLRG